jgi:hypothetical protein
MAGLGIANFVNGGAGTDSIQLLSGSDFSTLVGGGLADTITIASALNGGIIYGDGKGVTTSGTGTGGLADGADRIGSTASTIAAASTIYGAGGGDSITFVSAGAASKFYGGDDADSIRIDDAGAAASVFGGLGGDTVKVATAALTLYADLGAGNDYVQSETGSAVSILAGAGTDTILFTNIAANAASISGGDNADAIYFGTASTSVGSFLGSGTIDGGNGADTIKLMSMATASSINGGAGLDSIVLTTAATNAAFSAIGTVNGGAGVDTISIASTGGLAIGTAVTNSAGLGSIVYGAGDVITVLTTAIAAGDVFNGIVFNGSSAGFTAGKKSALTAGALGVYSDGTDTYFSLYTLVASAIVFRVTGADLVTTAASDNGNNAVNSTNFGFSLSSTASKSVSITLT